MSRVTISAVKGREIIDCRGFPTVQVEVWCGDRLMGRADVPAGRSTGTHEAHELRDGDPDRYGGLGVRKAVARVNEEIGPALVGWDVTDQRRIDMAMVEMDGTPNKGRLGANAVLGVSLAVARAAAHACGVSLYRYLNPNGHVLPVPFMNLLNGGKLTSNYLEIQEFIMIPVGAGSFGEALEMTTTVNGILRDLVVEKYGILAVNTGDEGGFATPMRGVYEPLEFLSRAVEKAGYADDVLYAMDCASTHWYDREKGVYELDGKTYDRDALIGLYRDLKEKFPIASLEDPLHEEDFEGYAQITRELDIQIIGDDLFVTNLDRLREGVRRGAANALLFKVNQVGTLSEALDAAEFAYRHNYGVQVSERSGETEDPIIADLVVALNSGQIKTGAPVRGERTSKYNRLLQIEEELGGTAVYAGRNFTRPV
ncbi:MAG: phosphopyruvate hydratase [Deltaproteobacteria bacterium]|nr:phosphopyruvate hydratase [Deltaproteobacteria bacterium]